MATPGHWRHWVELEQGDGNAAPVTYSPKRVKCGIAPSSPGATDEQRITHLVEMEYHPQVSLDTALVYLDRHRVTHRLFVKGRQDVGLHNRRLVLYCEEVLSP